MPMLSPEAMDTLTQYNWPGNIRQLENTIQRNILLANNGVIECPEIPVSKTPSFFNLTKKDGFKTIIENERDHILAVLESCNWKISGKGGAAEILDINVNTLNSRMKKLGIERKSQNSQQ
jgi:transcriptional regulator of acetoin/glycerol metabolism